MADRFEKYRIQDDRFEKYKSQVNDNVMEPVDPLSAISDESFLSKLPRNIIAGLAKLGHSTINMPHDIVEGTENIGASLGDLFKKSFPVSKELQEKFDKSGKKNFKLSEYIPKQDEYDFAKLLGQQGRGTLMDNLIQGAVEHSPEIASLGDLLKTGIRNFPLSQRGAARKLREASRIAKDLSISVPLESKFIEGSKDFIPKTHASRELLEKAAKGDYESAFGLQSQIGKHERDLRKSSLAAERLLAPEARELKESILGNLESALRVQGHHKVADLLKGGLNDYRKYIKFRDEIKPLIGKIALPSTALGLLSLGYKKGKRLLES